MLFLLGSFSVICVVRRLILSISKICLFVEFDAVAGKTASLAEVGNDISTDFHTKLEMGHILSLHLIIGLDYKDIKQTIH